MLFLYTIVVCDGCSQSKFRSFQWIEFSNNFVIVFISFVNFFKLHNFLFVKIIHKIIR